MGTFRCIIGGTHRLGNDGGVTYGVWKTPALSTKMSRDAAWDGSWDAPALATSSNAAANASIDRIDARLHSIAVTVPAVATELRRQKEVQSKPRRL